MRREEELAAVGDRWLIARRRRSFLLADCDGK
jgi:hypothetical protein